MFQYMHYLFNETEIRFYKNINYFQTNYFNNFKIWVSPENHLNPFRKKWTDYFYYKRRKYMDKSRL